MIGRYAERLALRARVRWTHLSLDAMLVLGVDPASDPALALRASQLRSDRHRRRLAGWVERLVRDAAAARSPGISAAVPVVREQVTEARDSLLLLARALRHAEQVQPGGVAMVERLLSDARSVIYTDSSRGAVELQVQAALDYLTGTADSPALSSASATPLGRPRLTQTAYR
jgi:hypothetical protein